MSSKRALVVDDSKSARAFLSRILERHEIAVDAAESAEAAIDYLTRQSPRRDLHGSHDAGHGRLPGRAVDQEQPAHRRHPDPHVHLAGRRPVPRPGARARRRRRAAQADQAGRRHQDAVPAAARLRSPHARANYFHAPDRAPDLVPANESEIIVVQPRWQSCASARRSRECGRRGPAVRALLPQMSLEIRAALDTSLQKEIAALRGFHRHARSIRTPNACRATSPTLLPAAAHARARPAHRHARAPLLGRHCRLVCSRCSASPAPRPSTGSGGSRAAKSPRCAPISRPPTPSSRRCGRAPR